MIPPAHGIGKALFSIGEVFGKRCGDDGVDAQNYDGVTHEFFGMGLIVEKTKEAEQAAVTDLKASLAK